MELLTAGKNDSLGSFHTERNKDSQLLWAANFDILDDNDLSLGLGLSVQRSTCRFGPLCLPARRRRVFRVLCRLRLMKEYPQFEVHKSNYSIMFWGDNDFSLQIPVTLKIIQYLISLGRIVFFTKHSTNHSIGGICPSEIIAHPSPLVKFHLRMYLHPKNCCFDYCLYRL